MAPNICTGRIELVQWPAGHTDGITKADFA
jgi:hypothetical protein